MRRIVRTPEEEKKVRAAKNLSSKKNYDKNRKKLLMLAKERGSNIKRKISFKIYYEQLAQKVQEIKLNRILRRMKEQTFGRGIAQI